MKKLPGRSSFGPVKVNAFADKMLERCAIKRLDLKATMAAFLAGMGRQLGAQAAAAETLNEDLKREVYFWKAAPSFDLARTPAKVAVSAGRGLSWISQPLDVAGRRVGTIAFGYRRAVAPGADYLACLDAVCEELDGALWGVHNAAVKQKLMERVTRCLTRSVLREAIDEAVLALHTEIPFRHLGLVYRNEDAAEGQRIQYRIYRGRRCVHDSEQRPHKALSRAIAKMGINLLDPDRQVLRRLLGIEGGVGFSLSGRAAGAGQLGKLVVEVEGGLSTFGRDLMNIFANSISQRLIDYNRERRHMAKFFSPETVSELLQDPYYMRKHLSPRVKDIAILYVDINSFTKLCEKALLRPDRIGEFVDYWSEGAVRIAWRHGGVFDKMVGDCVIALFGPPFFRQSPAQCARAAALAACEIQAFTARMGRMPKYRGLAAKIKAKGLGVAAGINLCPAAVGLFGPNHDFTAFSSGMNQTARLQSKGGFREMLAMESVKEALQRAGLAKGLRFTGPFEVEAKNVSKPLRYFRLKPAGR
ncbi:MAG TPA: adenylate/guanylate cyclase domain-containing protein [Elusimicrobiales bacterium]|nr:adenylate/guanylate cyclase domain-containing protein [Elusimicrobiales bacterium]